ncbi:GTP cyclohydrolase 1 [Poriferisphaera corsica]|uniref:GTP cyclohydrolase 1 n=1 Tax=Poriferisphaera corsica TaxID=2528020 RepID=A0A517YYF9_9BACT|nr:GTP cyclohydrolase I FolE [Poriferisphaera corsica]QDU35260.1 GTP cyclohydrolase 1 [Poriferisphaera corsica]
MIEKVKPEAVQERTDANGHLKIDFEAAEHAMRQFLHAMGEDVDREGIIDTPRRVTKAMIELMSGRLEDVGEILSRRFKQETDSPVMLRDIELFSLCEHHLLPFIGKVHIAYLPGDGHVVGLSKLARLVDAYAKRPQIQEQLTNQIADALMEHLEPKGVLVWIESEHMCMKMRGIKKCNPVMQTIAARGLYEYDREARKELLGMLRGT